MPPRAVEQDDWVIGRIWGRGRLFPVFMAICRERVGRVSLSTKQSDDGLQMQPNLGGQLDMGSLRFGVADKCEFVAQFPWVSAAQRIPIEPTGGVRYIFVGISVSGISVSGAV